MPVYKCDVEHLLQLEIQKKRYRGIAASWVEGRLSLSGSVENPAALAARLLPRGSDARLVDSVGIKLFPANTLLLTGPGEFADDLQKLRAAVQADINELHAHLRSIAEGLYSSTYPLFFSPRFPDLEPWFVRPRGTLERTFNRENFRVDVTLRPANPGRLFGVAGEDPVAEYETGLRMARHEIIHYIIVVEVFLRNAGGVLARAQCTATNTDRANSGARQVAIELLRECRSQLAEHARVLNALL